MSSAPPYSVIVPAFRSHETIERCLHTLEAQIGLDAAYEIIVIDSSPDALTEKLIRQKFPQMTYHHSADRLLPHAARNRGAAMARGNMLIFTDPDAYADPCWLASLAAAHTEHGGAVAGSIDCYGRRWLDVGCHLCKYDFWLSGGSARAVSIAATVSFLCPRALYDELGGFPDDLMCGDIAFTQTLTRTGHRLIFAPDAVVEHHHLHAWRDVWHGRFLNGQDFARMRLRTEGWSGVRLIWEMLIAILLLRLLKNVGRVAINATRAGWGGWFIATLPLVLIGQITWLLGEASIYFRRLRGAS
jgi:glycosyltransferase involved in cell wall biosynthesis